MKHFLKYRRLWLFIALNMFIVHCINIEFLEHCQRLLNFPYQVLEEYEIKVFENLFISNSVEDSFNEPLTFDQFYDTKNNPSITHSSLGYFIYYFYLFRESFFHFFKNIEFVRTTQDILLRALNIPENFQNFHKVISIVQNRLANNLLFLDNTDLTNQSLNLYKIIKDEIFFNFNQEYEVNEFFNKSSDNYLSNFSTLYDDPIDILQMEFITSINCSYLFHQIKDFSEIVFNDSLNIHLHLNTRISNSYSFDNILINNNSFKRNTNLSQESQILEIFHVVDAAIKYEEFLDEEIENGIHYLVGNLIKKINPNFILARIQFRKLEEKKNPLVYYYLGLMHYIGIIYLKNFTKSMFYFEESAKSNISFALFMIGHQYNFGEGVQKDLLKAEEFYEIARQMGVSESSLMLANLYDQKNLTNNNVKEKFEFYLNNSLTSNLDEGNYLFVKRALYSQNTLINPFDCENAYNYLMKVMKSSDNKFFVSMGNIKMKEKQYQKAFNNYLMSGLLGYEEGFSMASNILQNYDIGFKCKYYENDICMFQLFLFNRNIESKKKFYCDMANLVYNHHDIFTLNFTNSLEFYRKCSLLGDPEGSLKYSLMISEGKGTKINKLEAINEFSDIKLKYKEEFSIYYRASIFKMISFLRSFPLFDYLINFFETLI